MTLKAGVQYNDFLGTAAADDGQQELFSALLEKKGLFDPTSEFLLGVRLWSGENHGGPAIPPTINAIIVDGSGYNNVQEQLDRQDPLVVREVEVPMSFAEFFGAFKRFEVVVLKGGLNLQDREYVLKE